MPQQVRIEALPSLPDIHPHSGALRMKMLLYILSSHTKELWVSNHVLSIDTLELLAVDDILESFRDTLALGNLEPLPGSPDVWAGTLIWGNAAPSAGKLTFLLPRKRG